MTYKINGGQQELYAFKIHGIKLSAPSYSANLLSLMKLAKLIFSKTPTQNRREDKQLIC